MIRPNFRCCMPGDTSLARKKNGSRLVANISRHPSLVSCKMLTRWYGPMHPQHHFFGMEVDPCHDLHEFNPTCTIDKSIDAAKVLVADNGVDQGFALASQHQFQTHRSEKNRSLRSHRKDRPYLFCV